MKGNTLTRILIIAVIILSIGVITLYTKNRLLKNEIAGLKNDSHNLEENFKALKRSYQLVTKENQALRESNVKLKQESASLSTSIKNTQFEVEQTIEKLNEFDSTVKDSIRWFKENTNIENLSDYDTIKKQLDKCVKLSDSCDIDLKCIYTINKNNNIRYRYDEDTVGKPDFLKDLKLILKQSGGDCEDFSLLYRAEFNYLLDKCLINYSRDEIYSIAIDQKTEEPFKIDEDYMYIICGNFDPKEIIGNVEGHCLNALTKGPINKSKDIYPQIAESIMVEPQIGEFYGNMNSTDYVKLFNDGVPPDTLHYVDFVITDDDLYIFDPYSDKVEWKGYHDFLKDSQQIRNSVIK